MSDAVHAPERPIQALVVFGDEVSVWWLRGLKQGFRHCFVLLQVKEGWVSIDPLLHQIEVMVLSDPSHKNFPDLFKNNGLSTVLIENIDKSDFKRPALIWSCVGLIKRVLGVRGFWVFTPYQLYCHLRRREKRR